MTTKSENGALKLCKRTYFMRTESVPTQSGMRHELGSETADVILECMSPECQAWMGVDRKLLGPSAYCVDSEELKYNIHEHILHLGQEAENMQKRRRKRNAKKSKLSEELEFAKFECRQKIEIARDEERKRMNLLLEAAKCELQEKFQKMKVELGEDYCKGRREMGQFMCRNFRNQARELLAHIAQQYRQELNREVNARVDREFQRISNQLDEIIQDAVDHQKTMDERAMRKMCYRYEELLRNVQHREACHQLSTLAQKICSEWIEMSKRKTNPDISCQTSFVLTEPNAESEMTDSNEYFEGPSDLLETDDIFIIESCFMRPGPSPVYSFASSSLEDDAVQSSSTLEALTFEGNVYAQPKYYQKFYDQLFPTPMATWERKAMELDKKSQSSMCSLISIDSDFTKNIVDRILDQEDLSEEAAIEIMLSNIDLSVEPTSESAESLPPEATISELFCLEKSESAINILANGIAIKYIRATERDFHQ